VDLNTFIVAVFYLTDNWMLSQEEPVRRRGPDPKLSDSEVITMEIVGEFLGIDTEKGIYTYFKRHYRGWFFRSWPKSTAPPSQDKRPTSGRSKRSSGSTSSAQSSCSRGRTQSPYS
jgi:hypothetical protein